MCISLFILSCDKSINGDDKITGTVIGSFYNGGVRSYLVQVDKSYPIGKTINYTQQSTCGIDLPKDGTYRNMVQVQVYLPLPGWPESYVDDFDWSKLEPILNKRISFTFREYQRSEEEEEGGDYLLFIIRWVPTNGLCQFPDVPIYIITDCQITK